MSARPLSPLPFLEIDPSVSHRKQTIWQIIVPVALSVLAMLATTLLIILSATRAPEPVSRWADISLIWIILPSLLTSLIFLAILIGLIYGLYRLFAVLPGFNRRLQVLFFYVSSIIRYRADQIVRPVIVTRGWWAGFQALRKPGRRA